MNKNRDMSAYIAGLGAIDTASLPEDGGERFNRLIFAQSPYLLQHAENPVQWYEWGPAAFAKARSENLPILLSIGYATCHWCHVMAHESFEDNEVAGLLNRHFICIKVDREERPDIDAFYMNVSQLMTGSGGWPLNIFMAPDKRPFMAVTYLPKRGRPGMSGLLELLANIAVLWRQQPDRIENNCRAVMQALQDDQRPTAAGLEADLQSASAAALQQLQRIYDAVHGGFGTAPKFPMPTYLQWLLGQGAAGSRQAEGMALDTLRRMRQGGIWDQLGGGLHRYSVDREWLVPHFEKMLYDQAMLALVALDACRVSNDPVFPEMIENLFSFVLRELRSPDGGFFSALDADSEGVEGRFYVWESSQINALLGPDAALFTEYYGVSESGNFEGFTILTVPRDLTSFCSQRGLDPESTAGRLAACRAVLLQARDQRIRPLCDRKVITGWNGLMIAALARAAAQLDNPSWLQTAGQAAGFILTRLRRPDGRLLRSYMKNASQTPAFLEDYAFLCNALLELYEASLKQHWLDEARALATDMATLFRDQRGGWQLSGNDAEQMPLPVAGDHDGVLPSALSSAALALVRLAWISEEEHWEESARSIIHQLGPEMARSPLNQLGALSAGVLLAMGPLTAEICSAVDSCLTVECIRLLKGSPLPNLAIRLGAPNGPAAVNLCGFGRCFPPLQSAAELEAALKQLQQTR